MFMSFNIYELVDFKLTEPKLDEWKLFECKTRCIQNSANEKFSAGKTLHMLEYVLSEDVELKLVVKKEAITSHKLTQLCLPRFDETV